MKTQTEINQAKERMLAAEKLISKAVGQNIFLSEADLLTEEQVIEFEEMLDQYSRDIDEYDEIINAMEDEKKKKSVKSVSPTKAGSALTAFKQRVNAVKSFASVMVKSFTSVIIKTTKVKNLIKATAIEGINLIKS
jgi:hypothetical protein